jgi:hypothetical protein
MNQAREVQGEGVAVVGEVSAGQAFDLVEPVDERVAVHVQRAGRADEVEALLGPGENGGA